MLTHRITVALLLPIHVALIIGVAMDHLSWWVPAISVGLHMVLILWGSFFLSSNFFLNAQVSGPTGTLALTYDDGPHPELTSALLDRLKEEGVKASFFCIGIKAEKHPEIIRRMQDEGHLIGTHSMTHPTTWGVLPMHSVVEQILQGVSAIERITGMRPTHFRPPFGVTSPPVARAVVQTGVRVMGWDIRTYDTTLRSTRNAISRAFRGGPRGTIVLMHDTVPTVVENTSALIALAREHGLKLVRADHEISDRA